MASTSTSTAMHDQRSRARAFALKHVRRLAYGIVASVPIISIGILHFERRLMYWPSAVRVAPAEAGLVGVTAEQLATSDGNRLTVWTAPARTGMPTILFLHGNGGSLRYRAKRFARYIEAGYGLYALAYRGFHGSTGRPSEIDNVADARLAFDTLVRRGVSASDVVIYGESLGASVAVQTGIARKARAVVLEAPFESMVDTWRQFIPHVPVGWLLRDQYRTIDAIAGLKAPLLVLHGERDRLVWHSQGRRVYASAPDPKRFESFPSARHNDLYDHGAFERMDAFLRETHPGLGASRER